MRTELLSPGKARVKTEPLPLVEDQALGNHPLLIKLAEFIAQRVGLSLVAILSDKTNWRQVRIGAVVRDPALCRMIHGSPEGAKRCMLCHVLMSTSAGLKEVAEQRCHAGLSALVTPLVLKSGHRSALISNCMLTTEAREKPWREVRACGTQLGLDPQQLRAAFDALPVVTSHQLELARTLLALTAETMAEIWARRSAEEALALRHTTAEPARPLRGRRQGYAGAPALSRNSNVATSGGSRNASTLIRAMAVRIASQPALHYSVAALADDARITPNHFSTLFHRGMGQRFSDFLTAQRIAMSKTLLQDLSLNINEVAHRAGYDDANYFARRFKLATGMTPRVWRNSLPGCKRWGPPAPTVAAPAASLDLIQHPD